MSAGQRNRRARWELAGFNPITKKACPANLKANSGFPGSQPGKWCWCGAHGPPDASARVVSRAGARSALIPYLRSRKSSDDRLERATDLFLVFHEREKVSNQSSRRAACVRFIVYPEPVVAASDRRLRPHAREPWVQYECPVRCIIKRMPVSEALLTRLRSETGKQALPGGYAVSRDDEGLLSIRQETVPALRTAPTS